MQEQPYDWAQDGPDELTDSARRILDFLERGKREVLVPEVSDDDLTSGTALRFYKALAWGGYQGDSLDGLRKQIDRLLKP